MTTHDSSLYDAYLEILAQETPLSPEEFLDQHDGASAALEAKLHHIYRSLALSNQTQKSVSPSPLGETWGEFRILKPLGSGGMGLVYLAEQMGLDRKVALKVIRPELASSNSAATRFQREAQAIASLRHPNIVAVHAVGQREDTHYIAMEYIDGMGLDEIMAKPDQPSIRAILTWFACLADALHYAHEHGIVHRDVKPANIRIDRENRAHLLDFGLARNDSHQGQSLTQSFLGSPAYMAPEQISPKGKDSQPPTDVYGLGITLYECLTGRVPFQGPHVEATFRSILEDTPPPLRRANSSVPRDLETVVLKTLEKEAARRYETASALANDLRAVLEYRPIEARPPSLMVRAHRFAKRHRSLSVASLTAIVLLSVLAGVWRARVESENKSRARVAQAELARAQGLIQDQTELWKELEEISREVERIDRDRFSEFTSKEEDRQLNEYAHRIQQIRRVREEKLQEAFASIESAEQWDADPSQVEQARADLYLAQFREAIRRRDQVSRDFFRQRVREHDHAGRLEASLRSGEIIQVTSDPPGAQVHLFRYLSLNELIENGEPRMVPVPESTLRLPEFPFDQPAPYALVVQEPDETWNPSYIIVAIAGHPIRGSVLAANDSGEILRGDRLLSIGETPIHRSADISELERDIHGTQAYRFQSGEETYEIHAPSLSSLGVEVLEPKALAALGELEVLAFVEGQWEEMWLPAGKTPRLSAAPLYVGPDSWFGITPCDIHVESDEYLALVQHDGYEPQRLFITASIGRTRTRQVHTSLEEVGTSPKGFNKIINTRADEAPFWIQESELSMAAYLEFLNDKDYHRNRALERAPRNGNNWQNGGHCPRDAEGRFSPPPEFGPEAPAFGLSWHDAQAYVDWLNRKTADDPWIYSLPKLNEWVIAGGAMQRSFVFGNSFRHKWASTCFSEPTPTIHPRFSYPIDESPWGVFDMTGSVTEWLDAWWIEPNLRHHAGGSWADGGPRSLFKIYGGQGAPPTMFGDTFGFRLVARKREPR